MTPVIGTERVQVDRYSGSPVPDELHRNRVGALMGSSAKIKSSDAPRSSSKLVEERVETMEYLCDWRMYVTFSLLFIYLFVCALLEGILKWEALDILLHWKPFLIELSACHNLS